MVSTTESSLCNQKVIAFLEEYRKTETQELFKHFAEVTRQRCEELLKSMKIKGLVQSRSKGYDSLETKLNDMAKTSEFTNWVAGTDDDGDFFVAEEFRLSGDDQDDIDMSDEETSGEYNKQGRGIYEHPDLGDLAGVRIGLFFPGDVAKVAERINEIFNVSHTFGTVTDTTRSAVDGRNQDIQMHGKGRWISQSSGQDVHHWEHYGYKSWQVVVEWKQPLPKDLESIEAAVASTKVFGPLRVEIQVGTVVSQAWAEVQHNIIYKSSNDIQATTTMKRMIDAINGLAITTDIILTELERSQAQAEKEAEAIREREKRNPEVRLCKACSDGDLRAVKRLLKGGVDVKGKVGRDALHSASIKGHEKVVEQLLLKGKANINGKDRDGWTALHWASYKGHDAVVEKLLLRDDVDLDAKVGGGEIALHLASKQGHEKVVKQLLLRGEIDANIKNNFGFTALHSASIKGHDKVVEQLLRKDGINVNAKDTFGMTALQTASKRGLEKVVKQLLLRGEIDANIKNSLGFTALHSASIKGHDKVVEQLLRKDGIDVNAKDTTGWTALHEASKEGYDKVVEQLLRKDGIDVNAKDIVGLTALHEAFANGHDKVVEQLLRKDGIDVNAKDNIGLTALPRAFANGHDKVVDQLLRKRRDRCQR